MQPDAPQPGAREERKPRLSGLSERPGVSGWPHPGGQQGPRKPALACGPEASSPPWQSLHGVRGSSQALSPGREEW